MTHITIKREVLEQAVLALDIGTREQELQAIAALRTALEAKDVEPYVWLYKDDMGDCQWFFTNPPEYSLPLYDRPAPDGGKP